MGEKCAILEVEGTKQSSRPKKTGKEEVVECTRVQSIDAVDRSKWKRMSRWKWSDRSSESDAVSCIRIMYVSGSLRLTWIHGR